MYRFLSFLIESNFRELERLTRELEAQLAFCRTVPHDQQAHAKLNRLRLAGEHAYYAHKRACQLYHLWEAAGVIDIQL